jgi:hypothetical protein
VLLRYILVIFLASISAYPSVASSAVNLTDVPLPYDYEIDWKCQHGKFAQKKCQAFRYYDISAVEGELRNELLHANDMLRPKEFNEDAAYAFLGSRGRATVLISMSSPDNVASYILFTLVDGKLVDHQLIGLDNMENNSVDRDFIINNTYQVSVFSRKARRGITAPRKILAKYQIEDNGIIRILE